MRDIKKELLEIKGGDFPKWYSSLSKLEKLEYEKALSELSEKFKNLREW